MNKMNKTTSFDIARIAGVSRSTVSRVINGYSNVPKETYDRVMKVIREQHYYPQFSGRQLSGKRTQTLGIFWIGNPNLSDSPVSSRFFMHIIDASAQRGYLALSCVVNDLKNNENIDYIRRIFMEGRIDAGIFVNTTNAEPLIDELAAAGKIVGMVDYYHEGENNPFKLSCNFDRNSGEQIIDYLVSLGHRKIAIVDGELDRTSCLDRHESCLRAMRKHNLPVRWITYGGIMEKSSYEPSKRMLREAMEAGDLPTAVYANNDGAAIGVYKACSELGLRIPQDISVIGTDGTPEGAYMNPPLSSFYIDIKSIYFSLVNRVIDTVEGVENVRQTEFIDGKLLPRASCAPPRQAQAE